MKDDVDRPVATVEAFERSGEVVGEGLRHCLVDRRQRVAGGRGIGCIGLDGDLGALTADEAAGQVGGHRHDELHVAALQELVRLVLAVAVPRTPWPVLRAATIEQVIALWSAARRRRQPGSLFGGQVA
jgi:hypothetical protein